MVTVLDSNSPGPPRATLGLVASVWCSDPGCRPRGAVELAAPTALPAPFRPSVGGLAEEMLVHHRRPSDSKGLAARPGRAGLNTEAPVAVATARAQGDATGLQQPGGCCAPPSHTTTHRTTHRTFSGDLSRSRVDRPAMSRCRCSPESARRRPEGMAPPPGGWSWRTVLMAGERIVTCPSHSLERQRPRRLIR